MFASRALLLLISLSLLSISTNAYVTTIHAPAVIQNLNIGNLTVIELNLTPGNGGVYINGPSSVGQDTLASAQTAAAYAASYLGLQEKQYNFNYTLKDDNTSVSGPSAGLAFTLLAISALQQRQLAKNFTVTGTISSDGSVGQIGGVYDKVGTAEASGMHYMLVPYASNSSFEDLLYYISQQTYKLPVIEVANVSQAIGYAFGTPEIPTLLINLTQNYNVADIGNANITCTGCNISAFTQLVNFTLNYTSGTISNVSDNFSAAKQQLANNINNYKQLAAGGYLYTAADFSFLDDINAFTLVNSQNYTRSNAKALISSISSYCSSLTSPPLTTTNYEFVVGGRLRQGWANVTINQSMQLLNSEQSTDDIIQSVYTAGQAFGWCNAASELYSISSNMGGSYVQFSPSLSTAASNAINTASKYPNSIYLQTAEQYYNSGDYATALYSATYANVFSPSVPNVSNSQLYSKVLQYIGNATTGVWPSQFAIQSEFYFRESLLSTGAGAQGKMDQAYTTALLASSLEAANNAIASSFIASNQTSLASIMQQQQMEQQITGIQQSVSQIYVLLFVNAIMLFVVLVVLLIHMLPRAPPKTQAAQKRAMKR